MTTSQEAIYKLLTKLFMGVNARLQPEDQTLLDGILWDLAGRVTLKVGDK